MFKESYDKEILKAWPDFAYVLKKTKFNGAAAATGGAFIQPMILSREHAWASAPSATTMTVPTGVPMTHLRASLLGSQLMGVGLLDYEAAARAQKSKASFVDATSLLVENLMETGGFRLEHQFLYGQKGIAVAASGSATTCVVAAADWCPALFGGLEGAHVAHYDSSGVFQRHAVIASIDYATRTITVDTGTAIAVGHIIGFRNSWSGDSALTNECKGLESILLEDTSLYGISVATTYASLRGNRVAVGGNLTVSGILDGLLTAVNRGLRKNVTILVSPKGWQTLVNPVVDPKALVTVSGQVKAGLQVNKSLDGTKIAFGVDGITIHVQNGLKAEIIPHMLVREGDAFAVPMEDVRRVGAQELSFQTPGRDEEIFLQSATYGAFELRCYANQAIYLPQPNRAVLFNGIS